MSVDVGMKACLADFLGGMLFTALTPVIAGVSPNMLGVWYLINMIASIVSIVALQSKGALWLIGWVFAAWMLASAELLNFGGMVYYLIVPFIVLLGVLAYEWRSSSGI